MLKTRLCLNLILTCLLLPYSQGQEKSRRLATASLELGLAALKSTENGTSAVVVAHSIFDGLAMLLEGADGNTKSQLLRKVFRAYSSVDVQQHQLQQRQTIGNFSESKMNYIDIVTLKSKENLEIRMKGIANGKKIENVNVDRNSVDVIEKLNRFVSRLTNDIVKDAFKPTPQEEPLLLTNAVYFKALWKKQFPPDATKNKPFEVESDKCKVNGENPTVPMMSSTMNVPYKRFSYLFDAAGVRLPFGDADRETSFYAFLPPNSSVTVDQLLSALNGDVWMKIVYDLKNVKIYESEYSDEEGEPATVSLRMPAFNASSSISLKTNLQKMGVKDMFDQRRANFAKFEAGSGLFVDNVKHKAFLEINEKGAEGAGLSQVPLAFRSSPTYTFNAMRPFAYVIANTNNGDVYFLGRFMGPNC